MSQRDSENLERIRELLEAQLGSESYPSGYEESPWTLGRLLAGAVMLAFWGFVILAVVRGPNWFFGLFL